MGLRDAKIILLNGTSSAGKSSICKQLKAELPGPFWHFSSDHFVEQSVRAKSRFDSGEFVWQEHRPRFFDGYHQMLAGFANAGNNILIEHVIEQAAWVRQIADLLADADVYIVSVSCPIDVLVARERSRGNRPTGDALYHLATYDLVHHDLEVDSTLGVEICSEQIIRNWHERKSAGAFRQYWC